MSKEKSPPVASGRQANCMPPGLTMWLIPADLPEVIADINARLAKANGRKRVNSPSLWSSPAGR